MAGDESKLNSESPDDAGRIERLDAFANLKRLIEKHRLTFLWFAEAWPESLEFKRLQRDRSARFRQQKTDPDGEFLFGVRAFLEEYLNRVVAHYELTFKPGTAHANAEDQKCQELIESRGTWWQLDENACCHLDESATAVLEACRQVARLSACGSVAAILRTVRTALYDGDKTRWERFVRWEYLERLDAAIDELSRADLEGQFDSLGQQRHDKESVRRPGESSRFWRGCRGSEVPIVRRA